MSTLVINLYGAPGAGKSTGAAYIFAKLKMAGVNAELITEFAKELVWEQDKIGLRNYSYVFGNQLLRLQRVMDKVDVVITDSPLLLSAFYCDILDEPFRRHCINCNANFDAINIWVDRVKPYNEVGRVHSLSQSDEIAIKLENMLKELHILLWHIRGEQDGYDKVVEAIKYRLKVE